MKNRHNERVVIRGVETGLLRIDDEGRVWRIAYQGKAEQIKPIAPKRAETPTPSGYLKVHYTHNGKIIYAQAHRLVWQYYYGNIADGMQINHKDGNKINNHPANLEVVTPRGNVAHAIATGLVRVNGADNGNARLSDADVVEIRRLYAAGQSQATIAAQFGIRQNYVSKLVRGAMRCAAGGIITRRGKRRGKNGRYIIWD